MRPDPPLGLWGLLPPAWTASARRRRLTFVATLAPGAVLAVAGAQMLAAPALMLAGLAWMALVALARRLSEPRFLAREALAARPPLSNEEAES